MKTFKERFTVEELPDGNFCVGLTNTNGTYILKTLDGCYINLFFELLNIIKIGEHHWFPAIGYYQADDIGDVFSFIQIYGLEFY